jgi:hypothetical protein
MNKISTKYFNALFQYINTFEEEEHHPAFGSQFETVIESFEEIKISFGFPFILANSRMF